MIHDHKIQFIPSEGRGSSKLQATPSDAVCGWARSSPPPVTKKISGRPKVDQSTDGKLPKQHQHIIKISNQSFITCGFINYFDDTNYYQSLSINDCLLHQINIINDCHLLVLVQVQRWLQLLLAFPSMSFGRRLICKRGSRFWRSGSLVACKHCCFEPSRVETWNVHYGCAEHSDLEPLMALWLKLWWWWVKGNVFRRGGFF